MNDLSSIHRRQSIVELLNRQGHHVIPFCVKARYNPFASRPREQAAGLLDKAGDAPYGSDAFRQAVFADDFFQEDS